MPSLKFVRTSRISTWALASLILLLTACHSVPTKQPLAIQLPPREKPVAAMVKLDPPPPPADFSKLPPEQQAAAAQVLYINVLDMAGKCYKTRDQLIQWINGD